MDNAFGRKVGCFDGALALYRDYEYVKGCVVGLVLKELGVSGSSSRIEVEKV